ncbi:NUDIX domain-containing protein [Candidatus Gracilibacteria bacterium]|nr:NUDIX domain-containing protein [Candidatus Gracilibacteria bacterium]
MARLFEKSSGGIVYRKKGNSFEILLLERKNPKGQIVYVIPKGRIEDEEKAKETALREISEETGLLESELEIIKFITKINFTFVASYKEGSPTINKDVYLFLVKYIGENEPNLKSFENIGAEREKIIGFKWFKLAELKGIDVKPDIFSYVKKNLQYM